MSGWVEDLKDFVTKEFEPYYRKARLWGNGFKNHRSRVLSFKDEPLPIHVLY